MGKSVSGGCVGLPAQPRTPRNFRPLNVMEGFTENSLGMSNLLRIAVGSLEAGRH